MTGINHKQFRKYIIQTTLPENMYSKNIEELLIFTGAAETLGGACIVQEPNPIAKGYYQQQDNDFNDAFVNWLSAHPVIYNQLKALFFPNLTRPSAEMLIGNLYFATWMARIHYLRVPEKLPDASDVVGMATYYVKYWNCGGKADTAQSIQKYHAYIGK